MQRLMSNSRHGRPRSPVITSLHERMPNSRWVSDIVLRPSAAGIEEELSDLGLLDDVVPLLPDDWRQRGDLLDL